MERRDLFDEVAKKALEQAKKRLDAEDLRPNCIEEVRALVEIAALANAEARG